MLHHKIRDYDNRCGGNENCAAAEAHCPGLTWMTTLCMDGGGASLSTQPCQLPPDSEGYYLLSPAFLLALEQLFCYSKFALYA